MRYRVTINRSLLDSDPSNPNVIRVEDTQTGTVEHFDQIALVTVDPRKPPVLRFGERQRDGARVWIDTDKYVASKDVTTKPGVELSKRRVADAERRARAMKLTIDHHMRAARAEAAKLETLCRTWGLDPDDF